MRTQKVHSPDYIFLAAVMVLLVFGLASLISASSVISFKDYGDSYYKVKQQILHGILPGIFLFFLFFKIGYERIKKFIPFLMVASIFSLVLVLIPGIGLSHGSARSWLGFQGLSFQPAEMMKLVFILYLALWFGKRNEKEIKDFYSGFLPFLVLLGVVVGLIILQPDLGTAIITVMIGLVIYFLAGAKKVHLALIGLVGVLFIFIFLQIAPDYQKNRLTSFLNPQYDTQGIGYHINQAFLAIGSGEMWGVGFGKSSQKFLYLPEVVGDSIFAIMAEEMGFVVCFLFLALISFIVFRGFQIAKNSPNMFTYLTVVGIIGWFAIQGIVNIAAMVGLMPLTGVTLPLVSYGGSSMMVFLAAFGIILNISKYTK
ncbi:cell division protein FtsW [Candidatus Falkowbacteria bacterium]|jgi:cell division protein FtsW|nr:cell division protein FtsW [Candidatus Falkowbacteria bacterium]MBT4433283.1 cell division protein FtsW [Candidatus Falkowbacteria bacterium]